jgi:hypothetical protein
MQFQDNDEKPFTKSIVEIFKENKFLYVAAPMVRYSKYVLNCLRSTIIFMLFHNTVVFLTICSFVDYRFVYFVDAGVAIWPTHQ